MKILACGKLANESERKAIRTLRALALPDDFLLLHNLEINNDKINQVFELDLLLVSARKIVLFDVTSTGEPAQEAIKEKLAKCKRLSGILKNALLRLAPGLKNIQFEAAVLITESKAAANSSPSDGVFYLRQSEKLSSFLQAVEQSKDSDPGLAEPLLLQEKVLELLGVKESSEFSGWGSWTLVDTLGREEDSGYREYLVEHRHSPGSLAKLRIFPIDIYADEKEREKQITLHKNAFSLDDKTRHNNILYVSEFALSENEDYAVSVFEYFPGENLEHIIDSGKLDFDEKMSVIRQVLAALEHAHNNGVIHRNLTPRAILYKEGKTKITPFEFGKLTDGATHTLTRLKHLSDIDYRAPECEDDLRKAGFQSDLFSAGMIFYELLSGQAAFEGAVEKHKRRARFRLNASEINKSLPCGLDSWLQKLCAWKIEDRFQSVGEAAEALDAASWEEYRPCEIFDERFEIIEKLGVGGFAVAYLVRDLVTEKRRVLKLARSDRSEHMKAEFRILVAALEQEHINVIKAFEFGSFKGRSWIVFEYLPGEVLSRKLICPLEPETVLKIARQAASGLAHLHRNQVFHQDIKPANLLLTESDCLKIIDFNIASDQERNVDGFSRMYVPQQSYDLDETQAKVDRDLYALGITLYECLTGGIYPDRAAPAEPGASDQKLKIPAKLAKLVVKIISPEPRDRFKSADELLDALDLLDLDEQEEVPDTGKWVTELTDNSLVQLSRDYLSEANELYNQTRYTEALSLYNQAFAGASSHAAVYRGRAKTFLALGEYRKAEADFSKAINLEPDDAALYAYCGYAFLMMKDFETSVENYDKAIKLEPENRAHLLGRVFVFEVMGNFDAALKDYDRAIELAEAAGNIDNNELLSLYFSRFNLQSSLKNTSAALADCNKVIELGKSVVGQEARLKLCEAFISENAKTEPAELENPKLDNEIITPKGETGAPGKKDAKKEEEVSWPLLVLSVLLLPITLPLSLIAWIFESEKRSGPLFAAFFLWVFLFGGWDHIRSIAYRHIDPHLPAELHKLIYPDRIWLNSSVKPIRQEKIIRGYDSILENKSGSSTSGLGGLRSGTGSGGTGGLSGGSGLGGLKSGSTGSLINGASGFGTGGYSGLSGGTGLGGLRSGSSGAGGLSGISRTGRIGGSSGSSDTGSLINGASGFGTGGYSGLSGGTGLGGLKSGSSGSSDTGTSLNGASGFGKDWHSGSAGGSSLFFDSKKLYIQNKEKR